jgi:site-specific DNA-cytosine methylase
LKFAGIIPLIGGMDIGTAKAFNQDPEYLISYKAFWNNDRHIVNHYQSTLSKDVPYYVIDNGDSPHTKVDVVHSTCPCAGLSQLSHGYGDDNPANDWMPKAAEYVLGTIRPAAYFGENAPGLAGKIGQNVRANLISIGKKYGYTASFYRTRSLLHGIPQVRERSFYFFWKGNKTPILNYYNEPHQKIEDLIINVKSNSQMDPINPKTPSESDPYYRFILEVIHGGISHREFSTKVLEPLKARGNDSLSYIELQGYNYTQVGEWMAKQGLEREVAKCAKRQAKLDAGGNLMRRGTVVPKDYIGAFVGHYPTCLTHPIHDRFITYREAMSIMGLPENFELLDPKKSANHICQNVPVKTAHDMAVEVREALNGNRQWVNKPLVFQYNHTQKHVYEKEAPRTLEDILA